MLKKIFYVIIFLTLFLTTLNVEAENNNQTIKKVISIVYDDSGSMDNINEDWAYASYSIQNLIGLVNPQDELNIVKMSSPTSNITFDITKKETRLNAINESKNWHANGNTPFLTVETAVNWLKTKKQEYQNSTSIEYFLIIITDGEFGTNYPTNMPDYLNNLKTTMGSSKYEGIFVAIGNSVPDYIKKDWTSVTGNHLITASNSTDIINAMFKTAGLILGQGDKNAYIDITTNNNSISFNSYFPLKKFIIYEQNQNINIKNIKLNETEAIITNDFDTTYPGTKNITSKIIHIEEKNSNYIPPGKITINFNSKIDSSNDKFKILVEPAVNVELKVLDKSGKIIDNLNTISFKENELIDFVAYVTSSIDNTKIDLTNWKDQLEGQLIINNKSVNLTYNPKDNNFYGSATINKDNNLTYATINLEGYFRAKSKVINIYSKDIIDNISSNISKGVVNIPYKYTNNYEEIETFKYTVVGGNLNGICNFQFKNLPKGITISVNGIYVDKDGIASTIIHSDIPVDIKIYRNKDYQEIEKSIIKINVTNNEYELYWKENSITEIILNPTKRDITIEKLELIDNTTIKLNNFNKNPIYILSILANNEYLSLEELKTLKLDYDELKGISLEKEVIEYNGRYALKLYSNKIKSNLFIETGNINTNITISTKYKETSPQETISFNIIDSLTKYIIPLLIILTIILIIGYLPGIKKRLNPNKYYLKTNNIPEAIYLIKYTRLLPYIKEKATASDLIITATNSKNKITVINNFSNDAIIYLNNELIDNQKNINLTIHDELKVIEYQRETTYTYNHNNDDLTNAYDNINDINMFSNEPNNEDIYFY